MAPGFHRRGFTIVELMIVIGIIGMLTGLLLPSLAEARRVAWATRCHAQIREVASLTTLYAGDHHDMFPCFRDPTVANNGDREERLRWILQIASTLPNEKFLEYSGRHILDRSFRCPANQSIRANPDEVSNFDYFVTASWYADVMYLNPDTEESDWRSRLGARVQAISSVEFPSSKASHYEFEVWHWWRGAYSPDGYETSELSYHGATRPGGVAWVDGSVSPLLATHARLGVYRYPMWPSGAFTTTAWGVRGRDR